MRPVGIKPKLIFQIVEIREKKRRREKEKKLKRKKRKRGKSKLVRGKKPNVHIENLFNF